MRCIDYEQGLFLREFQLLSTNMFFTFQTLTTLNLERNQIGEDGARYLSDVLRSNTVIRVFLVYSGFDFLLSRL